MIETNVKNFRKNACFFIGAYVLLNIVILFIVFLNVLPGYSDKLCVPINDSDISILKIEPVLQKLGKYDKNYTLNIHGSEFKFGLNIKKVRQILMVSLIVFFIPNFIFFVFLLYTYINKIKDFTRRHKLKIIVFISIYVIMNVSLFLWIDSYFNAPKSSISFVPLKRDAVIVNSIYTEITEKGWYNSQLTQTIAGSEYYIAINLMRVKEVALIFLKRFYIFNYIYTILLIIYMRYIISFTYEKIINMKITGILFYIGCVLFCVSLIIRKIVKEDVFLYTLFMEVFVIGCMLPKIYLDWKYDYCSGKKSTWIFIRLLASSLIFIAALLMLIKSLSGGL